MKESFYKNIFQDGAHDPEIDARSALKLYLLDQVQWEQSINHRKYLQQSLTTQMGDNEHNSGITSYNRFDILDNVE